MWIAAAQGNTDCHGEPVCGAKILPFTRGGMEGY